jgi:hypothetical protein
MTPRRPVGHHRVDPCSASRREMAIRIARRGGRETASQGVSGMAIRGTLPGAPRVRGDEIGLAGGRRVGHRAAAAAPAPGAGGAASPGR